MKARAQKMKTSHQRRLPKKKKVVKIILLFGEMILFNGFQLFLETLIRNPSKNSINSIQNTFLALRLPDRLEVLITNNE